MEIRIEFEYGPIRAEIDSDAEESYDGVLAELASFIEDHDEIFGDVEVRNNVVLDGQSANDVGSSDESVKVEDSSWESLVDETGVSEEKLQYIFSVDSTLPQILVGEHITGSDSDEMEEGTMLLLTVWEHYYGRDSATTSDVRECLKNSGLPHDRYPNIYRRDSFKRRFVREEIDREGGGTMYEIKLTPPGRNEAYRMIADLAEKIEG